MSTPRKPVNFTFYPSFANACSCHSCLIHFLVNLKNNNKKRLLGQELHVSYTTISRPRFCRITPIRKLSVLLNGMLDRNRLPPSLPLSPPPSPSLLLPPSLSKLRMPAYKIQTTIFLRKTLWMNLDINRAVFE